MNKTNTHVIANPMILHFNIIASINRCGLDTMAGDETLWKCGFRQERGAEPQIEVFKQLIDTNLNNRQQPSNLKKKVGTMKTYLHKSSSVVEAKAAENRPPTAAPQTQRPARTGGMYTMIPSGLLPAWPGTIPSPGVAGGASLVSFLTRGVNTGVSQTQITGSGEYASPSYEM
jgi:hypothetical protein